MTIDSPTAFCSFGDEHPGSVHQSRITSCGANDVGQFANHAELLFAVQHVDGSEDLDAHVIAAAGGIRNRFARQFMNESSGVLFEEINGRDVFPLHNGFRQVLRQFAPIGECACDGVTINHWHDGVPFGMLPSREVAIQFRASLSLDLAYHRGKPLFPASPRSPRISGQVFSKLASRCSPRSSTPPMRCWASGHVSAAPNEVKASRSRSVGGNETWLTRPFAAAMARRSKDAMRRASASTNPSSSASGSARLTYPYRSAVSPSKSFAPRTISSARPRPTRGGRRSAPPPPGCSPTPTSGWPSRVFSRDAKRMSQARTNSLLTPRAHPRIFAMLTTGDLVRRTNVSIRIGRPEAPTAVMMFPILPVKSKWAR